MKRLIDYIFNANKTDNLFFCGGKNCDWKNAYDDFMSVKEDYGKMGGIQAIHFTQAFSPEDNVTPQMAMELAERLLEFEKFNGFQIIYAVHNDRNHIHTHFVINSVNMETGLKWHMGKNEKDLQPIKDFSDKLCKEYGLKTLTEVVMGKGGMTETEYRRKTMAESWKYEMYLSVLNARNRAVSKEDFINIMKELGYDVKWEDSRKYITFTSPNNLKCRNSKIYPTQLFTKEALEKQFEVNAAEKTDDVRDFINMINEYKAENPNAKYPLSEMKQENNNIIGTDSYEYVLKHEDELEHDIKFRLYRCLMYSLGRAKSIEELESILLNSGINVNMSEEEYIEFNIENLTYTSDDLYPADNFTMTAITEKVGINKNKYEIEKLLKQSMYKSKDISEFYDKLSAEGCTIKYRTDDSGFAVIRNDGFIYNSNEMKNPDMYDKDNMKVFFEEKAVKSELNRALFISSKTAYNMDEFAEQMRDKGYEVSEQDGKLLYIKDEKMYTENDVYPKNVYTPEGLGEQFEFNIDKKECNAAAFRLRQISPSINHFTAGMKKLGYTVTWNNDGTMEVKSDKGNMFKGKDIYPPNIYTEQSIKEQCRHTADNIKLNMFCNIVSVLRSLDRDERLPVSSMQNNNDLSGEKLKEYMYHYEAGSIYNKNLDGYLNNTDYER